MPKYNVCLWDHYIREVHYVVEAENDLEAENKAFDIHDKIVHPDYSEHDLNYSETTCEENELVEPEEQW